MVSLAERQRSTGALTLGATFALTLVASLRTGNTPAALPPPSVEPAAPRETPYQGIEVECPMAVRAQLHLASPMDVSCVPGNYPAPGYFVHATYDTTEPWERYGIVDLDGRVRMPMTDRPQLHPMFFAAQDLDGDGCDEIVGFLQDCNEVSIDVMALHGDALAVTSQRIPVRPGPSSCRVGGIGFDHHKILIDGSAYRLDRGWLVFDGSLRDH